MNKDEMSVQQKIWKEISVFLYAVQPLFLYMIVPAAATMLGRLFSRGRTIGEMVAESGNFYYTLGIILTFVLLHKKSRKCGSSLAEDTTLDYKAVEWKKVLYLLGIGFGFGFFFSALITVVPFPRILMQDYAEASEAVKDGTDPLLALLSTVLLAPVVEEMIFRGYMLNRLLSWFDVKKSILITAIMFALCHISLIWIVYAFLMGLMLANVSVKEDNTVYSIAMHMGFNANVVPIWIVNHAERLAENVFANHMLIACYGILACGMAVWLLKKYGRETLW